MKGKQMAVRELEALINSELKQLDGRKYRAADHFEWSRDLIQKVLRDNGIQEMKTYMYWVTLNIEHPVLSLGCNDRVATIKTDVKADKRIKYGAGRGTINSMTVAFDSEILDMSLDEARAHLISKKRLECLGRLEKMRTNAEEEVRLANAQIAQLMTAEF